MRLRNERGSTILEATVTTFILVMTLLGLFRLARTGVAEQAAHDAVQFSAWAKETGAPGVPGAVKTTDELLGTRATLEHGHSTHKSLRIDMGEGW